MFVIVHVLVFVISCAIAQAGPKRTAVGAACFSGTDCTAVDETCVQQLVIVSGGKPSIISHSGHCTTLGGVGAHCYVRATSGKQSAMVYQTPCAAGLRCIGSGVNEVFFGEVGQCGYDATD